MDLQVLEIKIKVKDHIYLITFLEDKIVVESPSGGNAKYIPWGDIGNAIAGAMADFWNDNFKNNQNQSYEFSKK